MTPRLKVFVVGVGVVAIALLALTLPRPFQNYWGHYLAWTAISLLSELLWLKTLRINREAH